MYFVLHPRGLNMSGRWVGLGYDDKITTGWGSMAKTAEALACGPRQPRAEPAQGSSEGTDIGSLGRGERNRQPQRRTAGEGPRFR